MKVSTPLETAAGIDDRTFGDPGKILLLLRSAARKKTAVDEDRIDSYIFLLRASEVLHFNYSFRFQPLPYSPLLHDDLYKLAQAEYVSYSSPISITSQGRRWVDARLPSGVAERARVLDAIGTHLREFSSWSADQLLRSVYARVGAPGAAM